MQKSWCICWTIGITMMQPFWACIISFSFIKFAAFSETRRYSTTCKNIHKYVQSRNKFIWYKQTHSCKAGEDKNLVILVWLSNIKDCRNSPTVIQCSKQIQKSSTRHNTWRGDSLLDLIQSNIYTAAEEVHTQHHGVLVT